MKTLCPNCEKETECEFTAELYECKECGEDFAKYIVARKLPDEKSKEDETFAQLKVEQYLRQQIETLQFANEGLRRHKILILILIILILIIIKTGKRSEMRKDNTGTRQEVKDE